MTTATLTPLSVSIDNSGGYDKFLTALEKNIGKSKAGDIRLVLHADEDKQLYIPRFDNLKGRYNLFVNPTDVDTLLEQTSEAHQSIGMMLKERAQTSGYYVIWSSPTQIHLVPAPTKKVARKTNGFA